MKRLYSLILFLIILILSILLTVFFLRRGKNVDKDLVDNDYFVNSILRHVRNNKLSLMTEINVFDMEEENGQSKKELMNVIEGIYDFESKIERQKLENYEDGKKEWTKDLLAIDNLSEFYEIDYDQETCESYDSNSRNTMFGFYLKVFYLEKKFFVHNNYLFCFQRTG